MLSKTDETINYTFDGEQGQKKVGATARRKKASTPLTVLDQIKNRLTKLSSDASHNWSDYVVRLSPVSWREQLNSITAFGLQIEPNAHTPLRRPTVGVPNVNFNPGGETTLMRFRVRLNRNFLSATYSMLKRAIGVCCR